eukprot:6204154-Pleurochrysis_carterae.AAC.1
MLAPLYSSALHRPRNPFYKRLLPPRYPPYLLGRLERGNPNMASKVSSCNQHVKHDQMHPLAANRRLRAERSARHVVVSQPCLHAPLLGPVNAAIWPWSRPCEKHTHWASIGEQHAPPLTT